MSAFNGYLFKATKNNQIFPHEYIQFDSYDSTPKQREEIKAYRDEDSRELHRITAKGTKSKITFTTRPNLRLADKERILKFFTDNESNQHERKINIVYWDDENSRYDSGDFYRPDINFAIKRIEGNDLIYKELKITLIEY